MRTSIIGRAHAQGLFDYKAYQLREFATDSYRAVDGLAYGGGGGMVLKLEPLVAAVESIRAQIGSQESKIVCFTAAGTLLNQALISNLEHSCTQHFILVCGHYEGIDQRFIDHWVDLEVSLGEFVVTGGELPALTFADALIRRLGGALGNEAGAKNESFVLEDPIDGKRLIEYPHYTRPQKFRNYYVPDVLLSGDHASISKWRLKQARVRTEKNVRREDDKPTNY